MGDQQQLILATGGYDHTIKVWQAHTGNCIKTMRFVETSVGINRYVHFPVNERALTCSK